jgi:cyclic pyranopterin phosphate synthase
MPDASKLTHLDQRGMLRMVDVSDKRPTARRAVASAVVCLGEAAFEQLAAGQVAKAWPESWRPSAPVS